MAYPLHHSNISGDKHNVANYRPISLLCVTSKVLERLVFNHVIGYLTKHLSNQQFGFMTGWSSLQQLLLFMNNILEARTQLSNADVIYLDFRKAFDSVPHNELLYKLWKYGIIGDLWLWFRAYLSSRTQCVEINGCLSGLLPVVSGVTQRSTLGPLLFVLYIQMFYPQPYLIYLLNSYTCTSILLLLNRHSIKPYYIMISMLCSIMVTLGICFSIILSVHTCIFISIRVQTLLLTTSIIWKYPKNLKQKI